MFQILKKNGHLPPGPLPKMPPHSVIIIIFISTKMFKYNYLSLKFVKFSIVTDQVIVWILRSQYSRQMIFIVPFILYAAQACFLKSAADADNDISYLCPLLVIYSVLADLVSLLLVRYCATVCLFSIHSNILHIVSLQFNIF